MELEFKVDKLKDIRYTAVSARLKKYDKIKDDGEVTGLFLGFQPMVTTNTPLASKEEMYIWLSEGEYCHILSAKHYEVTTLFLGAKESDWQFSGKHSDTDKNEGRLSIIHQSMKAATRVNDNGLINTDTYSGLPDTLKKKIKNKSESDSSSKTTTDTTKTSGYNRSGGAYTSGACGYSSTTSTKKETSTRLFKRTTRYPVSEAIESMWAKITEIKEGTYTPPKLKAFKEEKKKEPDKKESSVSANNSTPEYDYYGCM